MIIDTAPYTIVDCSGGLEVQNAAGQAIARIAIYPVDWIEDDSPEGGIEIPEAERIALESELARLIENAPALLSTTRRYIHRLRTTMTQIANIPADSLASIISAIEGPPASE